MKETIAGFFNIIMVLAIKYNCPVHMTISWNVEIDMNAF